MLQLPASKTGSNKCPNILKSQFSFNSSSDPKSLTAFLLRSVKTKHVSKHLDFYPPDIFSVHNVLFIDLMYEMILQSSCRQY